MRKVDGLQYNLFMNSILISCKYYLKIITGVHDFI